MGTITGWRSTGVKFTHVVGDPRRRAAGGLFRLLRDREVPTERGDVVEVTLHVVPKDQVKQNRRLSRYLKQRDRDLDEELARRQKKEVQDRLARADGDVELADDLARSQGARR